MEPKAKMNSLAPFPSEGRASVSIFDGKNPVRTHSLPQPYLPHPPTEHGGPFHYRSSKAPVDPGHYTQTIFALEAELHRAHKELTELKEQLAVSETGKVQALKEFTNIKNLLDQISLVEHFAASDNVEVETAPLPPNWSDCSSGQLNVMTQNDIDRLRNELEASKNLNLKFAAELDKAKREIDDVRDQRTSLELENSRMELIRLQSKLEAGRDQQESIYLELDNAKKDISSLQATLSDTWSSHGACVLELSRAKEEIAWLEADLEAAQNLTVELAHAKDDINTLREDLEFARRLQETSSTELLKAKDEISRLQSQHEASSSELATAINNYSTLQTDLEYLQGLHEASAMELQSAKQEIFKLRAAYETTVSESADAKDEIRRLQGELASELTSGIDSATALRDTEEKMGNLESKLEFVKGQYDRNCIEHSEATGQIEKLRAELEALRVKYGCCSSELFNAKEDVFRLEVELASHESLMTDIRISQEENLKLQAEVAAVKAEKISLSVELAEAREEINNAQAELEAAVKRHDACKELFGAAKDVARLQGELSAIQEQHGDCFRELEILKDISSNFQNELTHVQELHNILMEELINAREDVAKLQLVSTEEFESSLDVVRNLKEEIGEVQDDLSMQYTTLILERSLMEKTTKDLALELMATNTRLQEASASQKKAETELAPTTKENVAASTLRAELEAVRAELVKAREAETKLERMTLEVEELRAEVEELRAEVEELRAQVAFRKQSRTTELSVDMDALRTELDAVKKSEANYREIVNSSQARTFKLDLDEATAKLEKAIESERTMSASMASLKAELNNARTQLAATLEDHRMALAKEQQYELELNQMRSQWEVAAEAEAEETVLSVRQATQEAEKARQEVEEAEALIETLKAKLEMLQLEVEAAKASEEWAFAQMRLKTIAECDMEIDEREGEIPVSFEEYQSLKAKVKELQDLVNKRAAVGMAQVNAAKASEKEMQRRMETLEKELRSCRTELNAAITKREEAEAAKFSCEAALRAKRLERKSLSHSGALNGGHPMGKLMNVGDRQGSLNSICFEDSQSSSPSCSSKSFASFASPGRSERSPVESIAHVLTTTMPSEEKQRKPKFSSKIGAYFSKKKVLV